MSATIAPPRPTQRATADAPCPAPRPARGSTGRPALRLVAGSAPRPSRAARTAAQSVRSAQSGVSAPGPRLRLVRDPAPAQPTASVRPGPARPSSGAPSPASPPSPGDAPSPAAAAAPTATARPSTAPPAGGRDEGLSLPAGLPRRPGAPLSLRSSTRSGTGRAAGAGHEVIRAQPSQAPRSSRMSRIEEMELLAPSHPAVRAARRRARQTGTAPGSERPIRAGLAQRPGPRSAVRAGRAASSAPARPAGQAPRSGSRTAALMSLPVPVRRFIAALGACTVVIMLVACAVAASGLLAPQATRTTTAVVQPGQSLWEIASATGTTDVSRTMTAIVELNDLEDPTIHAGQQLTVPVH